MRTRKDINLPLWARAADAAAMILTLIAVLAALYPFQIDALHLSVRRFSRPLMAAVVIAVARHAFVRAPTLPAIVRDAVITFSHRHAALSFAVPVALVTRALVLLVGYIAALTIPFPSDSPIPYSRSNAWWDLPFRWDAGWYLNVVKNGYSWTGEAGVGQTLNFFPAYPLLVRAIASIVSPTAMPRDAALAWTATMVSIAAFAAAAVYLYRFAAEQFGDRIASAAVVILAAYPFAVFYSAVYSESLFLLCTIAAWYHMRRSEHVAAFVWGAIAGLCRPNGALLSIALIVDAIARRARSAPAFTAAAAPLAGMLLYSAFAYHLTGRPFVWAELQRAAWGRTYQGLSSTVGTELKLLYEIGLVRYLNAWPWQALNLAPTVGTLISVWPVTRRLGIAAGVFVAANTLLPLLNGGLVGMGRYTATLFPMFVWLALAVDGRWLGVVACCFGAGQALIAALFFTWRPIM